MSKVSLRVYNREIEGLIDQGHLQEAIAHCRHILQSFPKHLETYRLLGKAYLEAKRYIEAVDVFSRVLMAVPDDFVSHVGMSIIRDDQNKLDDAIWHMERAFEAQPSNAAIQAELQRLFGRRDGSQPPRIRMTRGALAHMYIQGELYPQAISEIKAVLAQDNQREDMKTLLARAYFHTGQKADASDICSQLLNHYAYSFDANRIMLELLRGSGTTESVRIYRERVHDLDPYSAFTDGSVLRSNEVSDAAVSLERLEYRGQGVEPAAEWEPESAQPLSAPPEPEWLSSAGMAPLEEKPLPQADTKSEIPEFMRKAGWREASGAAAEPPSIEGEPELPGEDSLTPAEIPDWLKAIAPGETEEETPATPASEMPEWLGELPGEEPATDVSVEELPAWLQGLDEEEGEEPAEESSLPDWLKSSGEPAPLGLEFEEQASLEEKELEPLQTESRAEEDFFKFEALEESPSTQPEEGQIEPETPLVEFPEEPELASGLYSTEPETGEEPVLITPELLVGELPEQETVFVEPEAVEKPVAAEPDSFARPEVPGELVPIEPVIEPETAPATAESLLEEPAPEQPELGPVTPLPTIPAPGMTTREQDEAMAWLESLASKHGAKAEELVTDPSTRSEKPPAWVERDLAMSEAQAAIVEPVSESLEPAGEIPQAEAISPEEPALDMPEWLSRADTVTQGAEETQPITPVGIGPEASDLPDWLRGLDEEKQGLAPAPAGEELPSWLQGGKEAVAQAEPAASMDWQDIKADEFPELGFISEIEPTLEAKIPEPVEFAEEEELPAPPEEYKTGPEPEPVVYRQPTPPASKKAPVRPPAERRPSAIAAVPDPELALAQSDMKRGNIPSALDQYGRLIKKGRWLEEIIRDLREALYRYPVEVTIWQTLGDAYMRENRLQEALDSYTKAEELLR